MNKSILMVSVLEMIAFFLAGCGQSSNPYSSIAKLYQPSPDTDVTTSPEYNFASFTGTVSRTKVKTSVADVKRYTGAHDIKLLPPKHFDPTYPEYTPGADTQIIAVLPVGARVRIERLMQDKGAWGGLMVAATVEDGTNSWRDVRLDPMLLANNAFMLHFWSYSTNWDVAPEMLEK